MTTKPVGLDVEFALERCAAAVSGELDFGTRHVLSGAGERLLANGLARRSQGSGAQAERARSGAPAQLDISGLRFIDASGLATLLELCGAFAAAGLELRLVNPSPCVRRICALCHLDALLEPGTEPPETVACQPGLRSRQREALDAGSEVEP